MCEEKNVFCVHRKDEDPEQKIEFKTRLGKCLKVRPNDSPLKSEDTQPYSVLEHSTLSL